MRPDWLRRFDRSERDGTVPRMSAIRRAHVRKHIEEHECSHGAAPKQLALAHRIEFPRVAQHRPDPASARRCSLPAALLACLLFVPRIGFPDILPQSLLPSVILSSANDAPFCLGPAPNRQLLPEMTDAATVAGLPAAPPKLEKKPVKFSNLLCKFGFGSFFAL
jgi:hypothetical protein